MEKRSSKRMSIVLGMVGLMFVFFSSEAFPWGFATHAYINDHLGKTRGLCNASEIYGGMAPDAFNYLFDYPEYMAFLTEETHANFMKVWESARWGLQKPLAYGFVSHGVSDLTAHGERSNAIEGYAVVKAVELLNKNDLPPEIAGPINELRNQTGDDILTEMVHIIVENAVDILILRDGHLIGRKITSAALLRSPELPLLLVKAYASDLATTFQTTPLEASKFIVSAEKEFRKSIILYGQILTLDEPTALRLISEQTANAAVAYLGLYEIDISGLFQDQEDLIQLIIALTDVAISSCVDDYRDELDYTINLVDQWLEENDVSY